MTSSYWTEFAILLAAAFFGGVAIMPYSLRLLKESSQKKPLKMSVSRLLVLSFLQTGILSAFVIGVGLIAAHAIGLGAPYLEAAITGGVISVSIASMLTIAIGLGLLAGLVLLLADILFLPYFPPALLSAAQNTTLWENFTASFYGGINEELLMRFFGLSVLAWLLSLLWHTSMGLPTTAVFWIANVILAILFGIGHLPALKGLMGKMTPVMIARSLLLNAPVGLLCGWLFWQYGIEAAIVAHFVADIIYHVVGTIVLRLKTQKGLSLSNE